MNLLNQDGAEKLFSSIAHAMFVSKRVADKNCAYCHGTGEMHIANGEDDFDVEECYCVRN